jgi:hypothetical protein
VDPEAQIRQPAERFAPPGAVRPAELPMNPIHVVPRWALSVVMELHPDRDFIVLDEMDGMI